MKILKLKALNINSLKGEVEIDFTTFLNDNTLFAITGPTGAGKSTILDIITCALYGRTPRLKNPNELMARHTGECLCEVEFEIKGKVYRNSWRQWKAYKKPEGEFQGPEMEIVDIKTGKIIESKKNLVPKLIEELSGLDFDRFKQSMVLAQGGFDAFLKADEKERSTLLEKITGTQIYKQISQEIYSSFKTLETNIESDKKILNSTQLLDIKDVEEMSTALEEKRKEKLKLDKEEKELFKIKVWLDTLAKLESDEKKYNELFKLVSKEKDDKKDEFKKLELANKALNLQPIYTEQNALEIDIKKDEQSYIQITSDLKEIDKKLSFTKKEYRLSQKETLRAKESFDNESKKIKEVRTLRTQIEEKEKSLDIEKEKISIKEIDKSKHEKDQTLISKKYDEVQKEIDKTKEYLNKNKTDESLIESLLLIEKNIKELETENSTLQKLVLDKKDIFKKEEEQSSIFSVKKQELEKLKLEFDEKDKKYKEIEKSSLDDLSKEQDLRENLKGIELLLNSLKEYETLIKNINDEETEHNINIKEQDHLTKEIKTKQSLVDELQKHLLTLREKRESELLIQNYEEDRKKLSQGDECFLCGSKDHPYIKNNIVSNVNETTKSIEEKELESKRYEEELKALNTNLAKLEQKIESSIFELEKLQKQKDTILEIFTKESVKLKDDTKADLEEELENINDSLDLIVKRREEKEALLKQRDSSSSLYQLKQKGFLEFEKELIQTINLKEQIIKAEEKANENINSIKEQLTLQYKSYSLIFQIENYQENFILLHNRKSLYQTNHSKNNELTSKINQIQIDKKENETKLISLENELKTDNQTKDTLFLAINQLKENSIKILNVADINTYETTINNSFKQVQEKENKLNKEQLTLTTKNEELTKQELALKEKLISSKQTLERVKEKLQNELKNNNFETIETFKTAILSKEKREELTTICKDIEDRYKEYQTLKENNAKALQEHKKQDIEIKPKEEIEEKLSEYKKQIDELQSNIGEVSAILNRDKQDRQKYQKKIEEIEKKKETFKIWTKLNEMVGSADGNKFAKFAQGITLDQLINLANNHLSLLSNRYELQRGSGQKHILEIEVIDSYQGDVIRPVSTLSGGESFIVSLSLALGLSELASQKISIDSLFLDEGFGTLDEDSLETALNALNLLQSSGKMVGVISHVEALKERIPLQIKVVPRGDGTSVLDLN